jgi:hypothetical protein
MDQPELQQASSNCAKTNDWIEAVALGDELELTETINIFIGYIKIDQQMH